jgi:hypothetical protein
MRTIEKGVLSLILLICGLFAAVPARATIAYVQSTGGVADSTTAVSAAFGSNNTAGCLLVVTVASRYESNEFFGSGGPWLLAPTDSAGDTFTFIHQYFGYYTIDNNVGSWYTTDCKGGANTVTATVKSGYTSYLSVTATEYSGTGIILDQQGAGACGAASNTGTSNVIASPAVYTSTASELVYAWVYNSENTATISANNSYTIRQSVGTTADEGVLAVADKNVTTRGAYSATFSGLQTDFNTPYSGAISFSEGGSVTTPAIEQVVCGDSLEPWHELGYLSGQDLYLNASMAGDYLFVAYRVRPNSTTPTISDTNSYTWTSIQTAVTPYFNYALWYAVVPSNEPAGDIVSFGNVTYNNAGRLVEIHGLSSLPTLSTSNGDTDSMSLSVSGYTSPAYCTGDSECTMSTTWNGAILDTRSVLGDFLIVGEADGDGWPANIIPGTSGHVGTDLFPTDLSYIGMWLPGATYTPQRPRIIDN